MKTKPAVLITGAGTGIGAATARLFSENGHDVILTGRRREVLEASAKRLSGKSLIIPTDLTDSVQVKKLTAEAIKKMPHLGVLINNAGIYEKGDFLMTNDEAWFRLFDTNLLGVVRLSRQVIPHFQKQKAGVIINISSTAGLRPVAGLSAYVTMKSAVISLTQCLALELAPSGIRVNAVCPGIVETPIHQLEKLDKASREKVKKQMAAMHPLDRLGRPEDVAWGIYALSVEQAGWITGAVLPVDGGISVR